MLCLRIEVKVRRYDEGHAMQMVSPIEGGSDTCSWGACTRMGTESCMSDALVGRQNPFPVTVPSCGHSLRDVAN